MTTHTTTDLYRKVKPNQLKVKFKHDGSTSTVNLDQLFQNVPPHLLGSFRIDYKQREVDILKADGSIMTTRISQKFRPQYISVKGLNGSGISCFNWESHMENGNILQLPPVGNDPLEVDRYYFLEAAEIPQNATLLDLLQNDPQNVNFTYNNMKCATFLSFQLPSGQQLPNGFECYFDNDPTGHWTISPLSSTTPEYCQIGDGFNYALVSSLLTLGWRFHGIRLKAAGEPDDFHDTYDEDLWRISMIIYEHFGQLSSEELVNDASKFLLLTSSSSYARESCVNPESIGIVMRVLDELFAYCESEELDAIKKFKDSLNCAIINIFGPLLSVSGKVIDEKSIMHSGTFWCSVFHKLSFNTVDYDDHPQQPLSLQGQKFKTFFSKLNPSCKEFPSNNILNALTYKFTLYYLQDTVNEICNQGVPDKKVEMESGGQANIQIESMKSSYALLNTTFIKRTSKQRTEWQCAVCLEGCKIGETWYTLCNCGHKFHVECLGKWIFTDFAPESCPICRVGVGEM